jgi:hypothetical protein
VVSNLSPSQIDTIVSAFLDGFKILLTKRVEDLRASLAAMNDLAQRASNDASKKFEIFGMSCGKIEDFHHGLSRRIGLCPNFQVFRIQIAVRGSFLL